MLNQTACLEYCTTEQDLNIALCNTAEGIGTCSVTECNTNSCAIINDLKADCDTNCNFNGQRRLVDISNRKKQKWLWAHFKKL